MGDITKNQTEISKVFEKVFIRFNFKATYIEYAPTFICFYYEGKKYKVEIKEIKK